MIILGEVIGNNCLTGRERITNVKPEKEVLP